MKRGSGRRSGSTAGRGAVMLPMLSVRAVIVLLRAEGRRVGAGGAAVGRVADVVAVASDDVRTDVDARFHGRNGQCPLRNMLLYALLVGRFRPNKSLAKPAN